MNLGNMSPVSNDAVVTKVISFDDDFAIFRYGRNRSSAFELLR